MPTKAEDMMNVANRIAADLGEPKPYADRPEVSPAMSDEKKMDLKQTWTIADAAPNNIVFNVGGKAILTINRDGITADPSVHVDEAAKAIFIALEPYLKNLK